MSKILVTRSSMPDIEEYVGQIKGLWESRWLTNAGSLHQELTEKLKNYLNVSCFELFSNGHLALEIAIQASGLTGEVITTPYTFLSTTQAIVRSGLTPVFCDIDPVRLTIDVNQIESLITERTSAIVAVHVYGIPCDVEAIEKIKKKHPKVTAFGCFLYIYETQLRANCMQYDRLAPEIIMHKIGSKFF